MPMVIDGLRRRIGDVSGAYSQNAFDAADNAADRAADHRPDRAGRLITDIGAMRDAVGDALRLR
jgi:hypothetical protein